MTAEALDPTTAQIIQMMDAFFPKLGIDVHDAAEARAVIANAPRPPVEPIPVSHVEDRVIPGPAGAPDLMVRIYRPAGAPADAALPVVVFYHGGGWVIGDVNGHDQTVRQTANAVGAVFVSVEYRLAPETPFPGPVEDAYAAYTWARANAASFGGDPSRVAVAGDSAGGNLAAAVCLVAKDRGAEQPTFQLLVYPVTDNTREYPSHVENATGYFLTTGYMRWFRAQYLPTEADAAHPYASPVLGDLAGLAPAHVVAAGLDPLRDEGVAYAEALAAAGVPVTHGVYPGMFHGAFGMSAVVAAAKPAFDEAVAATRAGLGL
jgi:acetyl esterase